MQSTEAAPLAAEAQPAPKQSLPEETNEQILDRWKKDHIPMDAKPRICPYCKHPYLKPCNEQEHTGCLNWTWLQSQKKV